jgi:short-chain 2-methylacyl-CoA dehydrogenase
MDHFGLSEDLAELRETVAAFAHDKIAPVIGDFYARHEFPYEIIAQMGSMGLFGLAFPEEYGGMGGDYLAHCIAIEEIARVDSSVAITLEAAISLGAMPIFKYGTAEQKKQYLPDLIAGRKLAAFGLTEPGAGSDAGGTKTTARLSDDGSEWIVNGSKAFITNSGTDITTLVTVTARTGPDEISTIIVPSGTPGFTVAPGYDKVGWCASDTHELSFDGVRVPAGNLLGERGKGFKQFLEILDEGRVAIAALATGLAQGCVDESVSYSRQREAFGSPISAYQGVQFMIAEMEANARTARLAWRDAANRMVAGESLRQAAAVAKLHAGEMAMANARMATQVHGGYGFMNEFPVARFYRDAKILEIGEGTTEIQKMVIARGLGIS